MVTTLTENKDNMFLLPSPFVHVKNTTETFQYLASIHLIIHPRSISTSKIFLILVNGSVIFHRVGIPSRLPQFFFAGDLDGFRTFAITKQSCSEKLVPGPLCTHVGVLVREIPRVTLVCQRVSSAIFRQQCQVPRQKV